ncbi:NRDE-2, necessary for RNA interference-domain-containing protein [Xylariales sp. PMI_506]|nr:NRDE-2, necessary for RNA interference-domain-containing protein [Xylariales sp. PMI_506]
MSSKQGQKLSVPKFSSFKRKSEPVEEQRDPPRQPKESVSSSNNRGASKDSHDSSTARGGGESGKRNSGELKHSRAPGVHFNVSQRPAPSKPSSVALFIVDKKGDELIRRYGSNNRYDVPVYRRFGGGRILGADGYFKIDRTGTRELFVLGGFDKGSSGPGARRKTVLAMAKRRPSEVVRVRTEDSRTYTGVEDFLPLKESKKRKREEDGTVEPPDEDEPSYRSIHGMSKRHEHSDSDEIYDSDASTKSFRLDRHDPIKSKGIALSARVRDQPYDIDAWLELVDHQDILLSVNKDHSYGLTPAEIRSSADIKLSMLEKALGHATTSEHREKLRLRMMVEGCKIWDTKAITQHWENLIKDHGDSFQVWKEYLIFKQADLATVSYERTKQLYIDRIRSLEAMSNSNGIELSSVECYEQLVIIFLRVTQFMADAGYAELATAAWQALLELNFFRPSSSIDASIDTALSSFQAFWESEIPRIGELGAKGWAVYDQSGRTDEAPEPRYFEPCQSPTTRDPYKAWAVVEKQKTEGSRTPARTLDDGTEDDPYRVIMYADIQELLIIIPPAILPEIKEQVIDAFLIFCQLPPVFNTSKSIQNSLQDGLYNGVSRTALFTVEELRERGSGQESTGDSIRLPDFTQKYKTMAKGVDVLFPSQHWHAYLTVVREATSTDQYELVTNVLKQLTSHIAGDGLATYYFSFVAVNNGDSSRKVAKALLKQNPANIDLYIGFSLSEYAKGSKEAAKNVISAALSLPGVTLHSRLRLCMAWSWMELEDGQTGQSLTRLCHVSEDATTDEPVSPAWLLKTRQLMASNRDHYLSTRDLEIACIYAEGIILLEYLTKTSGKEPRSGIQGDIWSAMAYTFSCSEEFISRGFANSSSHEALLQFAARLLYVHTIHGPYRPAFLHEQVQRFIELFPQNTIFLTLYAWREQRLSIDDRVRAILDKTVLTKAQDCVSSRVFAIRHEMSFGNPHSTRAAFERAVVDSRPGKHHIGLWISYIRYCHQNKELRAKAKDVFYRAVQSCPWSKEVFMEAFVTLIRDMDTSELKSIYNTLCEKGLRVHVELDEFVQSWKKSHGREAATRR